MVFMIIMIVGAVALIICWCAFEHYEKETVPVQPGSERGFYRKEMKLVEEQGDF